MKGKISQGFFDTLPWRIAARKYDTGFYLILGKDHPDREVQILTLKDGPHPIKEHLDRINDNAEAIVSAVNGTYGQKIHPDAVPLLLDALKKLVEFNDVNHICDEYANNGDEYAPDTWQSSTLSLLFENAQKAINKSKL